MHALRKLELPEQLCNIIYHCISSASISINWNGEHTSSFSSSRSLRQGDPISPYLFILAIERLSHKINDLVNEGSWRPLKIGRGDGPKISHVCFADLILFAKANLDQVNMIKNAPVDFCHWFDKKVNLGKSEVFFSNNISLDNSVNLSRNWASSKQLI